MFLDFWEANKQKQQFVYNAQDDSQAAFPQFTSGGSSNNSSRGTSEDWVQQTNGLTINPALNINVVEGGFGTHNSTFSSEVRHAIVFAPMEHHEIDGGLRSSPITPALRCINHS